MPAPFQCPDDLINNPRCACRRITENGFKLYVSPDPRHKALCTGQIVICTLALAAGAADRVGVPGTALVGIGCAIVSEAIKTMETPG
jgi:hypothetical protein